MLRRMSFTRVAFPALAWQQSPTHPLEQKKVAQNGALAVLRFAPGFDDPLRCERSHVLYVLQGELELQLDHGCERLAAGEACVIERGTGHRARNFSSEPVLVLALSDVDPPGQSTEHFETRTISGLSRAHGTRAPRST